jgi:pimeloyl-ACP methyl ester carboxylesterase
VKAQPFHIKFPEAAVRDMTSRIGSTRFAQDPGNADWRYGTNGRFLQELANYWLQEFDWRDQERKMNALSHFRVSIDGVPVHFIHERGKGPKPVPLILSHGWPWTFWDLRKVIGPLSDPAAYGGDPADAFDVVIPSLPGFGFSTPLTVPGINFWRTADLWRVLMRDVLGYGRFGAQGGDFGSSIAAQLGHRYWQDTIGVHLTVMLPLGFWDATDGPKPEDYAAEEAEWAHRTNHFLATEMAYAQLQASKPQTLAYAMHDSPVGLAAWLWEKRRTWSDCDGDLERRFTKDELCTTASLYWLTECFGSSARYYYEAAHNLWRPDNPDSPVVRSPTAVAIFPKDVFLMPKAWAKRYYNLQRWTVMPRGGHFAPAEEPTMVVEDIRAFFRNLR